MGELAEVLERHFHTDIQVNLYASWTPTEGFGIHWDDRDTVIFQLEGCKRWRLYGPTRPNPLRDDIEAPTPPDGWPIAEIMLRAGGGLEQGGGSATWVGREWACEPWPDGGGLPRAGTGWLGRWSPDRRGAGLAVGGRRGGGGDPGGSRAVPAPVADQHGLTGAVDPPVRAGGLPRP
ncbi:JmjC domain-containing protein [Streptomyces sp. NPDC101206]|uniref:JmjC domain-containing protein n=1 Tax=Streptomyces sp. NPDC101206 TaxID=3366128 RepID=UPI003812BA80